MLLQNNNFIFSQTMMMPHPLSNVISLIFVQILTIFVTFQLLLASTNTTTIVDKICITWIAYIIVFIPTHIVDNDYCLLMASLAWYCGVKSKRIVVMCGWWWCCCCNSYSIGPTYTPKCKQNKFEDLYKVWASLFWDSNAFGNMIWIRSTWWWITYKEKSKLWIHHIRK